ncbi:MAG: HAMP domain-containing sensor histidine kinase [Bacteroidota bacterium]
MKLGKNKIIITIGIAAFSLVGLALIQFAIINKNIKIKSQQLDLSIPALMMRVQNEISMDGQFRSLLDNYSGTKRFTIKSDEHYQGLEGDFKNIVDRNITSDYEDVQYEVKAYLTSEHGCLLHSRRGREMLMAGQNILGHEHRFCLCNHTSNVFDFSMSYSDNGSILAQRNQSLFFASILLISLVIGAFVYTVFVINRQKQLSAIKNDFINNLTHEFKTPIFSISLAAKALKKSNEVSGSEKLTKYTDLIESEGERLKSQVDKVLQVSLVDSGNFTLDKKTFDVHKTIEKVARSFEVRLEEQGGKLSYKLDAVRHEIHADETHIKNVLYNLLDNAQKYSRETPDVSITTRNEDNTFVIAVRDQGIGMNKEEQNMVFDKFYRVQEGNVHERRGFGLGLSYVKGIIEAHQGLINLKSEPDIGSEFTIQIPYA